MGAGYFPRLVCALLIALGAVLAATALVRSGEHARARDVAAVAVHHDLGARLRVAAASRSASS